MRHIPVPVQPSIQFQTSPTAKVTSLTPSTPSGETQSMVNANSGEGQKVTIGIPSKPTQGMSLNSTPDAQKTAQKLVLFNIKGQFVTPQGLPVTLADGKLVMQQQPGLPGLQSSNLTSALLQGIKLTPHSISHLKEADKVERSKKLLETLSLPKQPVQGRESVAVTLTESTPVQESISGSQEPGVSGAEGNLLSKLMATPPITTKALSTSTATQNGTSPDSSNTVTMVTDS
ncbi:unnamed protein product [Owenia fusiformis]|uniref:Uncharacterized protein n=1 Tax=Owenia fusiformis TaxID=6347 RepID=A0A8S4NYH0_OWEFU|nr:unnamed protein product [Owenia fusiformis]